MSLQHSSICALTLSLLLFLGATGCNEAFEPLQENNRYYFSMSGYLDASADTQWVRVMPVLDSLFYTPRPNESTVTLEEIASGRKVVMNDSLVRYPHDTYAYNFWTTMNIQPDQTYRITATGSEGKSSYAEVIIPEDFPGPIVKIIYYFPPAMPEPPIPVEASITIPGAAKVADLQSIYSSQDGQSTISILHLKDSVSSETGEPAFLLDMRQNFTKVQAVLPLPDFISERNYLDLPDIKEYIYVAVAGPEYQVTRIDNAPVNAVSNVEKGVGYIAGIISKIVPLKSCYEANGVTLKPCPTIQHLEF